MREPTPRISFDIALGELFDEVDFNYDAYVSYLEEMHVDRETIEGIDIRVRADNTLYIDKNTEELRAIRAAYSRNSGIIDVFPYMVVYDFYKKRITQREEEGDVGIRDRFDTFWSESYSGHVIHDTAHKMRHVASNLEGNADHQQRTTQELAQAAMSQVEYENDPEEAICEAFAKEGPKNIIKLRIKTHPGKKPAAEAIAAD